jgi:hypothetical protein
MNVVELDKKNGNRLWKEAIKEELKQLTDYQTFLVLVSEKGYYNRLSESHLSTGS